MPTYQQPDQFPNNNTMTTCQHQHQLDLQNHQTNSTPTNQTSDELADDAQLSLCCEGPRDW